MNHAVDPSCVVLVRRTVVLVVRRTVVVLVRRAVVVLVNFVLQLGNFVLQRLDFAVDVGGGIGKLLECFQIAQLLLEVLQYLQKVNIQNENNNR